MARNRNEMKRLGKKQQKITKGTPSAVLLSIVIHVALFLLAGALVVFTVVKEKEVEFEAPKAVERPKMKLKKPKVKVKKTSKPKQTTRIVTKMNRASMPDIQLPEMSGMAADLGGDLGGFEMMPELDEVSVFGGGQTIGNDFVGTLYDFKRKRNGTPLTVALGKWKFLQEVGKFIENGCRPSTIARFYRSPKKLYTTTIMIPSTMSYFAPLAFGEMDMIGNEFMVYYEGQIVHPKGGRFRFWGMADTFLVVRVNERVVFDYARRFTYAWDGKESKKTSSHFGHFPAYVGSWIELEPGVPLKMEVVLGELSGSLFAAMLAIEEEGVDYPKNLEQRPLLPIFKTAELSRDQVDAIFELLPENMLDVTNGPVFNDYNTSEKKVVSQGEEEVVAVEPSVEDDLEETRLRQWTLKSGKGIEAEYVMQMGSETVLKNAVGKVLKIPTKELSVEDLDYLELMNPPSLKVVFLRHDDIAPLKDPPLPWYVTPVLKEITTGVKIEKTNQRPYSRRLKVELFAIADEIDGDNYVLQDRQEETFVLSKENDYSHELWGKKAYMRDYSDAAWVRRGLRHKGHMIVVTDERGEIIARDISNEWMLDIIDFLREFPVGRHFSKAGERVYPPRAKVAMDLWDTNPEF